LRREEKGRKCSVCPYRERGGKKEKKEGEKEGYKFPSLASALHIKKERKRKRSLAIEGGGESSIPPCSFINLRRGKGEKGRGRGAPLTDHLRERKKGKIKGCLILFRHRLLRTRKEKGKNMPRPEYKKKGGEAQPLSRQIRHLILAKRWGRKGGEEKVLG